MRYTMRTLILFTIAVLSVGVATSMGMLDKITTMVMRSEAGDAFIYIDDIGTPVNKITIDLTDEEGDGDGYGDTGQVKVENKADFTLNARVKNLEVAVFYETGENTSFLEYMTDNGRWEFYEDSDSSDELSSGDTKVGELKIKKSSTTYLDDGNTFKVSKGENRNLTILMEYEPYAPGRLTGATNYTVSFDIYVIKEKYGE